MSITTLAISILFIAIAVLGKLVFASYVNPITLFCGIWALILFLYSFQFLNLYDSSDLAISIILVGVISFFVGGMFYSFFSREKSHVFEQKLKPKDFGELQLNYNIILTLNVISILVLLIYAFSTIRLLMSGYSMAYIRYNFFSEEGTSFAGNATSSYIMDLFIWPWTYVIIPLSTIIFMFQKNFEDNKNKIKRRYILITSLIDVVLYVLVSAGRFSIAYYVFYFCFLLVLFVRNVHLSKKQKIMIVLLAIIACLAIEAISVSRRSRPLYQTAYLYLCGCVPFLSNRLNEFITSSNTFTFGLASLHGFIALLVIPFSKLIGGYPALYLTSVNNAYVDGRANIAPDVTYNAFVSPFYYFYIDGGVVGVVLLSFIFGFVAMFLYKRLFAEKTWSSLMVYCLFAMGIVFSMVRFQFNTIRYAVAFFYIALCFWKALRKVKIVWNGGANVRLRT